MKVALVYDRVNKWGGAERVLLALHELFPEAPLFTSVYNPEKAAWARVFTIKTSFLQSFPFARSLHELYAPLMPLAFESFNFDAYDLVISVTSESAKGIITKPHTTHLCYCLTPTRYLWSGYTEYFSNIILRTLSFPLVRYLRHWDKTAVARVDQFVAISHEVKKRIKKFYGEEAEVIYPPLTLRWRGEGRDERKKTTPYFLIVSRLVGYKRIDIAIQACNNLMLPLVIIGTGSQEAYLRSLAGETITFLGNLTDSQIVRYYRNCRALIFPGKEDFGLTIIEAQSFGKPVIAYKAGGALETIIAGKTGEFFSSLTSVSLGKKLEKFSEKRYNSNDCIAQSQKFRREVFIKKIRSVIKSL